MKTKSIFPKIILLFCLLAQSNFIYSQSFTTTISSKGSDYSITATYDSDGFCDCNDEYIFSVYKNSVSPSNFRGSKNSGTKNTGSVTFNVGPSNSASYVMNMLVKGKNDALFSCWIGCSGEGTTAKRTTSTAALKRPGTASATNGEDFITLTWKKGSNVPEKNLKYRIYRNGTEDEDLIATVSGSTYTYTDKDVAPGERHTYYIKTRTDSWGGHTSSSRTAFGTTRDRIARATDDEFDKVIISWDDVSEITDEVIIRRNGERIGSVELKSVSDTSFTDSDPTLIPGFTYDYSVTWFDPAEEREFILNTTGASLPNGRIRGKVLTPTSKRPVENVIVCAELEADIEGGTAGTTLCDTTDANGRYEIRQLYYYKEAEFTVTASKGDHGFQPAFFADQRLDLDRPNITELDFLDTTAFVISGYVNQRLNGVSCGLGGVEIWINGVYKGVKTNADGYYVTEVEEGGIYSIEPKLRNQEFTPNLQELVVEADLGDINFENTQTNFLKGSVTASCDIFIGQSMVRAYSEGGAGCIDTLIPTNDQGFYTAVLPARVYQVEVVRFEPKAGIDIAPDQLLSYFNTETVDISDEGETVNFTYREPPRIVVEGFPTDFCADLGYSVVDQQETYLLSIKVEEFFGGEVCPVQTGYVIIYDEVGDLANEPDTLMIENGKVDYELKPGLPNLVSPHQKLFQIEAVVEEVSSNWSEPIVVTGVRPREQTFTTVAPEVPFMILHDPPGDASYSYFEENNTSSLSMRMYGQLEGSLSARSQIKLGSAVSQTIFPGTSANFEAWGTVGTSFTVGSSVSAGTEFNMAMTNTETFKTSDSEQITGDEGDVFVGAAMNLIYAQVDIIEVNPNECSVNKDIDLIMGNDGFATTFMYTEEHVSDVLIPQLGGIRDFYEQTNSDSARIYENQISVWKQVLEQNATNKRNATFLENRSFSAGANYGSRVSTTTETSISLDLVMFMENSIVVGAGYEAIGSGASGEVETRIRMEIGASTTGTIQQEKITGFELRDDDPGDFFSVDVKKDPVYGTPVFDLVSGRSSCPWEVGTQPRETVQLQADSYIQSDVPENEAAVFQLTLGNISQSDETQTYLLSFLQATNPDGAIVRIGGSEAQGAIPYTIGAGAGANATVTINKGPRAENYQGLQFVLSSGCGDASIADTIALNVNFRSDYPTLVMERPLPSWLVNEGSNDELLVWFRDYDLDRLRKIQLQYSPKDRYEWQTAQEWQTANISTSPSGMATRWDVSQIPEGNYDLRFRADYGDADVFTAIVAGRMDRKGPSVFGLPNPADGELNGGDVISVSFDEAIACFGISNENVLFKNKENGQSYPTQVGCSGQTLIINPLWNIDDHFGEMIEIQVNSVQDLFENTNSDLISWQFQVGTSGGATVLDTDLDGIPDDVDNCKLAANPDQSDLDADGLGDACDDDIDGDGIANEVDNCPFFANPSQTDSNGNGIGDECEPEADGDGDGIANQEDNCPLTSNPDQSDIDQDGIGDICDDDIDGDGIANDLDNCPTLPNPDQLDANLVAGGSDCGNVVSSTEENLMGVNNLSVWPNPASTQLRLNLDLREAGRFSIQLVNMAGQSLQTITAQDLSRGAHNFDFDLRTIPAGMYFLQVTSNEGTTSEKVIITK